MHRGALFGPEVVTYFSVFHVIKTFDFKFKSVMFFGPKNITGNRPKDIILDAGVVFHSFLRITFDINPTMGA